MRQIKFRGKRIDTGEWVYGFWGTRPDGANFICPFENYESHAAIPESVSQFINVKGYTGEYKCRKDNEIELYEGDIVEAMSEGSKGRFEIKFRNEGALIWLLCPNWQSRKFWNISASDLGRAKGDYYDDLKLVGNVYDNPEFLSK